MKVLGRYNNLSKEYLDDLKEKGELRSLKPTETAVFRFATERVDPSDKSGTKVIYPKSYKLPMMDRVYDTFKEEIVDIGLVNGLDKEGNADSNRIIRRFVDLKPDTGEFFLHGNNDDDRYIYWFLQLCNKNGSNKRRTKNEGPEFYEVDRKGEAQRKLAVGNKKFEIEKYLRSIGYKDLQMIAQSIGWGGTESEEILRVKLIDYATQPKMVDVFEKQLQDSKLIEGKAMLKRAIDASVLEWNEVERKFIFAGGVIATLERVEGKKPHEQLDEYLKTTKDGDKILAGIKKQLAAKDAA